MRWHGVVSVAALIGAIVPASAQSSSERMKADVGKPISGPIIRNGAPDSIVRVSKDRLAYTFVKRDSGVTGSPITTIPVYGVGPVITGGGLSSYSRECRFTLYVRAPRDHMPEHEMIVVGYVPPSPECE